MGSLTIYLGLIAIMLAVPLPLLAQIPCYSSGPVTANLGLSIPTTNTLTNAWGPAINANASCLDSYLSGTTAIPAVRISKWIDVFETTTPANPASGYERWYANISTHQLSCVTSTGGSCAPSGGGGGSVTSVGYTVNSGSSSGIFAISGSPITSSGTFNLTIAGTSGGLAYLSNSTTLASSAALVGIVRGGNPPTASEISGDGSTSGSNMLTLASVNSNVGSFTNANITVNGKGLITAAANGTSGGGNTTSSTMTTGYIPQVTGANSIGNSSPRLDNGITLTGALSYLGSAGINIPNGGLTTGSGSTLCSGISNCIALGSSGTLGAVAMGNATSGSVTIQPTTGALGSAVASLPANTGVIAELNLAQTWSALQTFSSGVNSATYATATNCAVNSVSPAACGSAAAGAVVIPTTTTTYTINTSAVTSHSRIQLTWLSFAGDLPSSPTCVPPAITTEPTISAISTGVSFTIALASTSGQTCPMYTITD